MTSSNGDIAPGYRSSRSTVSSDAASSSTRRSSGASSGRIPAETRPEHGAPERITRGNRLACLALRRVELGGPPRNREHARADLRQVAVLRDPVQRDADLLDVDAFSA